MKIEKSNGSDRKTSNRNSRIGRNIIKITETGKKSTKERKNSSTIADFVGWVARSKTQRPSHILVILPPTIPIPMDC